MDGTRLTPTSYAGQQAEYASLRCPETFNWLLESPEYRTWRQTPPQALYFSGAPGAGKSVAASLVIRDLENRHRHRRPSDKECVGIAYIFFDYLRETEQTFVNIALCIIQQLKQRAASPQIPTLPSQSDDSQESWPAMEEPGEEIFGYLDDTIAHHSAVFIVLDALDECSVPCRMQILRALSNIRGRHPVLHVLVTSRAGPGPSLPGWFESAAHVEIRARDSDLKLLGSAAFSVLTGCPAVPGDQASRDRLMSKIVQAARGRFVGPLLASLRNCVVLLLENLG